MAETIINKNQSGSGIWTEDTLIAGNNISITQVQKPEIDANTIGLYHFNDNLKDEISGQNATVVDASYFSYTTGKFDNSLYCTTNISPAGSSSISLVNSVSNAGSYTIDYWFYTSATDGWQGLCFAYDSWYSRTGGIIFAPSLHKVSINNPFNGSSGIGTSSTNVDVEDVVSNTWIHIAYVYDSATNIKYLFINGKLVWSLSTGSVPPSISSAWYGQNMKNRYRVDELRFSNVARWTSNFNPFTQPYAPAGGTPQYQVNNTLDISGKQDVLTSASGYSSSGTQVLKNIDGVLTWVTEA